MWVTMVRTSSASVWAMAPGFSPKTPICHGMSRLFSRTTLPWVRWWKSSSMTPVSMTWSCYCSTGRQRWRGEVRAPQPRHSHPKAPHAGAKRCPTSAPTTPLLSPPRAARGHGLRPHARPSPAAAGLPRHRLLPAAHQRGLAAGWPGGAAGPGAEHQRRPAQRRPHLPAAQRPGRGPPRRAQLRLPRAAPQPGHPQPPRPVGWVPPAGMGTGCGLRVDALLMAAPAWCCHAHGRPLLSLTQKTTAQLQASASPSQCCSWRPQPLPGGFGGGSAGDVPLPPSSLRFTGRWVGLRVATAAALRG